MLNYGHTIGHAIETFFLEQNQQQPLLHGEAIAVGMICEAYLSVKKCGLKEQEFIEIKTLLLKYFPKHNISLYKEEKLLQIMSMDKKNDGIEIKAALLSEIGKCEYDIALTKEEILESLLFYSSL